MLEIVSAVAGTFVVVVTALSLLRAKAWWIRIWDFPRMQLAVVGTLALAGITLTGPLPGPWPRLLLVVALAATVAYQAVLVWRYSPIAPLEVQDSRGGSTDRHLALVMSNVLQYNRDAERLIRVLRSVESDVILCVETDEWWRDRLDVFRATHPHTVQCPLGNTYGMLLYSRLPLHDATIDFLVQPDIPSMQAKLELRDGQLVWLNCVHPRPPAPGEADESLERDAELLLVGKRVAGAELPVVVCGDLNDVAWSRTTRLFQKVSRLVEPRKGRGFYSTFHARVPGFRFPLDHIFHSDTFRLVTLLRLPYAGSDHFPVHAVLSFEPDAGHAQEAPDADADDEREARETIRKGKQEATS